MKICFVTHGDIESLATAKRATGMASPLIEAGHEVAIIFQDTPGNRTRAAMECPQAKLLFYHHGSPRAEVRQKRQLIKQYAPDVVYVCSIGVRNWVCPLLPPKGRIYVVEHSELPSAIPNYGLVKRLRELAMEWSTLVMFHGLISASRYLEQVFNRRAARLFMRKPNLYSPYAYSPHVLLKPGEKLAELQQRYAGRKVVLYLGTLAANYGIFDMLSAIEQLKAQREDFVFLVLGGSGRHREQAKQFVSDHQLGDRVEMLGYIPEADLASYFQLAHAFVSPLYDTVQDRARCPSKLFMYAAFGKPVITCRIGEAYEIFGDDGWYYEPGNVASLAGEMNRALDSEGRLPNAKALADAHSWATRVDDFLAWHAACFGQPSQQAQG